MSIRSRRKIIIANWKMNPQSLAEAKRLFLGIKKVASTLLNVETVLAPPFVYITELRKLYKGKKIKFAGQDVFWEESGSFTGEVSTTMLKGSGATHVIVGHSERRALGETDKEIHKKILAATRAGLIAVLCIGESNRDHANGVHLSFLSTQLELALRDLPKSMLSHIIIAYEPIWAIGRSEKEAMKPGELYETTLFIRKVLTNIFGKSIGLTVPVLYGGSAGKGNTKTLLTRGMVDGLLVGHASLDADEFSDMLRIAQHVS